MFMFTGGAEEKYLIIGAGSSGLPMARHFKKLGIPFEVVEANDDVGGNWYFGKPNSSVYRSTHLISSKPLTEYPDFPMPQDYPDYPSHWQVHEYFKAYARHFGLYENILFNTRVEKAEMLDGSGRWRVELSNGETKIYAGMVVANGHLFQPKIPQYPGSFTGEVLHSKNYKSSEQVKGKRVLVVGAGNSGCDIACEAAQNAQKTYHSTRRGYYYLPKFLFGIPSDQFGEIFLKLRVPLVLRRLAFKALLWLYQGKPSRLGLAKPDHALFESHPIVNSQLLYFLGHGDLQAKPDVQSFDGHKVSFVDGSHAEVDLVVWATGFEISFPFLEQKYLNWKNSRPELYLNVFHPDYDNLFFAGLIQPDSGQWGLVHHQCELIAQYVQGLATGQRGALQLRQVKGKRTSQRTAGIHYVESSRHLVEVEHFSYRNALVKWVKKLRSTARAEEVFAQTRLLWGFDAPRDTAGQLEARASAKR